MAHGAPDWWIQGIIPMQFLNLSDTPGDYIDRAGLVPEVNAGETALAWSAGKIDDHHTRHESGGDDIVDVSGLPPAAHETSHRSGGSDALAHANLNPQPNDHHTAFTAALSRAAIGDIFGADGKADADINLDGHVLISERSRYGPEEYVNYNQITQNAYWDTPNWKYVANGYANMIMMTDVNANIIMYTAPSGVADAIITFTARFWLDVSGNLTGVNTYDGITLKAPVQIGAAAFVPAITIQTWVNRGYDLKSSADVGPRSYFANVQLPHGLTVSELKLYGYRDDAAAGLVLTLERNAMTGSAVVMATCTANWTGGADSIADTSIDNPIINNTSYSYFLRLVLDPNDSIEDIRFFNARISFA